MSKYIVFLRHTDALSVSETFDEASRPLSKIGQKEAKKLASGLLVLLKCKSVTLVTSDYKRAIETADLVSQKLDIKDRITADFVRTGAYEPLRNLIESTQTEVLLVVGHQPYISEWVQMLTGNWIAFSKGSAACLLRSEGISLRWWMSAKELGKLKKKSR